nr:hypothetical protein GCM10020093_008450 [Planobispora longispora]
MDTAISLIDFTAVTPQPRPLDVRWIHGSPSAKHNTDPDIQAHRYDEHTFILRQNMAIDYEAPFLFLLFGNERAVLIDTGATASAEFFPCAGWSTSSSPAGSPVIPGGSTTCWCCTPIRTATTSRATVSSPTAPAPRWSERIWPQPGSTSGSARTPTPWRRSTWGPGAGVPARPGPP